MGKLRIFSEEEQGVGSFDGGNLIEQRPVSFPGEKTAVKRAGPLFYWAWAKSGRSGKIGMHPHKGFEIMTYVIEGSAEHKDTLGTLSVVGAGGVQVMQTGSGVSHEEQVEGNSELFQIWFEPDLQKSMRKMPTYNAYRHEDFPLQQEGSATVKTIIGEGSPVQLDADVLSYDISIAAEGSFTYRLSFGRILAALVIRGSGSVDSGGTVSSLKLKDFAVLEAGREDEVEVRLQAADSLRVYLIDAPAQAGYALYGK